MYIKKDDFHYLETLYNSLDPEGRRRFLEGLRKALGVKSGEEVLRSVRVVGEAFLNEQGTTPDEWVTRTLIRKAFKEAKP